MTNSIVAMVVKACGISVKEAEAIAEVENKEAESLYIDCAYVEQRDAEEAAYWAEVEREDREYYERNYKPFTEWVSVNISGKSIEDIAPETWDYYSDWHKDLYGFRPRYVPAKVERVENHLRFTVENESYKGLYGWHDLY